MTYRVFKKPSPTLDPSDQRSAFGRRRAAPETRASYSKATIAKAAALTLGAAFVAFEIAQIF